MKNKKFNKMTYYDHVKKTYCRLFLSYSCITHNIPYIYLNIGNYRWKNYFNDLKILTCYVIFIWNHPKYFT